MTNLDRLDMSRHESIIEVVKAVCKLTPDELVEGVKTLKERGATKPTIDILEKLLVWGSENETDNH